MILTCSGVYSPVLPFAALFRRPSHAVTFLLVELRVNGFRQLSVQGFRFLRLYAFLNRYTAIVGLVSILATTGTYLRATRTYFDHRIDHAVSARMGLYEHGDAHLHEVNPRSRPAGPPHGRRIPGRPTGSGCMK